MTKQEFDEAVELLKQRGGLARNETWSARAVYAACLVVMRDTLNIHDPTDAELAGFLAGLDRGSRKRLKSIADELEALGH